MSHGWRCRLRHLDAEFGQPPQLAGVGLAGRQAAIGALSVLSLVRLGCQCRYRAGDGNRTRVASLEAFLGHRFELAGKRADQPRRDAKFACLAGRSFACSSVGIRLRYGRGSAATSVVRWPVRARRDFSSPPARSPVTPEPGQNAMAHLRIDLIDGDQLCDLCSWPRPDPCAMSSQAYDPP